MADKKLTPKQKDKLQDLFKNRKVDPKKYLDKFKPKPKRRLPEKGFPRIPKSILDKLRKKKKDGVITFKELERMQKSKPKVMEAKKGGSAKFPDLSGDGKVTQKDILMGRGVIKKASGGQARKKKPSLKDTAKNVIEGFKKKRKINPDILRKKPKVRDLLYRPKYGPDGKIIKPKVSDLLYRPKYDSKGNIIKPKAVPMKKTKPRKMATGGVAGRLAQRGYGKARS